MGRPLFYYCRFAAAGEICKECHKSKCAFLEGNKAICRGGGPRAQRLVRVGVVPTTPPVSRKSPARDESLFGVSRRGNLLRARPKGNRRQLLWGSGWSLIHSGVGETTSNSLEARGSAAWMKSHGTSELGGMGIVLRGKVHGKAPPPILSLGVTVVIFDI